MTPRLVRLAPSMLDGLMALSAAAHWNQNEADWRAMLEFGQGWGLQVQDEAGRPRLAASTMVLPYERRFAWVSMVLVLPEWRRQGLAGRLLRVALDHLQRLGLEAVLDATPAGHPVYQAQGFVDAWHFTRWRLAGRSAPLPASPGAPDVRRLRQEDWPAVADLDAKAFGASRLPLLQHLAHRLPEAGWVLRQGGELRGYLLGRDGRTARQLGPLVVASREGAPAGLEAVALLDAAVGTIGTLGALGSPGAVGPPDRPSMEQPLVVDVRDGQTALQDWLSAQGFAPERPFTRMVLQPQRAAGGRGAEDVERAPRAEVARRAPGDPALVSLVAGPELG
jgi:GNAT superfamily N-acetyltransferase